MSVVRFNLGLFAQLLLSFILFTIIGTLAHESGHFLIGKMMGFKHSTLHYGSVSNDDTPEGYRLAYLKQQYKTQLQNNVSFPEKQLIVHLSAQVSKLHAYMLWGGPVQTMLTGTIGLMALTVLNQRRRGKQAALAVFQWLWVFLALFWLRQVANCTVMMVNLVRKGRYGHGDETRLSIYYNLPPYTLNLVTAGLGLFVVYYVVFRFIPQAQRLSFLAAGMVGGVAGYILWLKILGPVLLP